MQSEVLPNELQFVAPPTIPQARSYMFKQSSELTEYDLQKGQRVRINIPRLQRSYLMKDSYLRFRINMDVTTSTTAALWFDRCGAYGLFDRIEVYDYLGGTLLEQTNNLPALMTLLGDINYNFTEFNGKLSTTQGYDGSNISTTITDVNALELRTANNGFVLIPKANSSQACFATYEFTIPVPSFLGMLSDKYTPLHNGFSIDFFLNDPESAFVSRTSASVSTPITIKQAWISNMEWCCQVMELGEVAESMVMATNPFVIHSTQFRHFQDIILGGGAQSNFRFDMNLNVVSLRNIRFTMRPTAYIGLSWPRYGHRIRNFLQNWNFQYGSSYLPEIAGITARSSVVPVSKNGYTSFLLDAPNNDPYKASGNNQAFMELAKTVADDKQLSINWNEYRVDLASVPSVAFVNCSYTNASPSVFTITGSNLPTGTPLTFSSIGTGAGISLNTVYYVVSVDANTFKLNTSSGAAVTATSAGANATGTINTPYELYAGSVTTSVPMPVTMGSNTLCGKFAAGLDTRLSKKNAVSGIDTNGLMVSLNGTFDRDLIGSMVQANLDVWAEHDAFIQVIPGVATTVTF